MKLHRLHHINLEESTARILCTDDDGVDHNVDAPVPPQLALLLKDDDVVAFCRDAVAAKLVDESAKQLDDARGTREGLDKQSSARASMDRAIAGEVERHAAVLLKHAPTKLDEADEDVRAAAKRLQQQKVERAVASKPTRTRKR